METISMMDQNIVEIPTEINRIKEKTDRLIKNVCEYIIMEDLPPELCFMTLTTLAFSMLYNDGIVGEKVAIDSMIQIAITVYSGEGLEDE